jgi:hypothetical protein
VGGLRYYGAAGDSSGLGAATAGASAVGEATEVGQLQREHGAKIMFCQAVLAETATELDPVKNPSLVKLLVPVDIQSAGRLPYTNSNSKRLFEKKGKKRRQQQPGVEEVGRSRAGSMIG